MKCLETFLFQDLLGYLMSASSSGTDVFEYTYKIESASLVLMEIT